MTKFTFKHRGDWKAVVEMLNDTAAYFTVPAEKVVILYSERWIEMLKVALQDAHIPYNAEV